MVTRRVISLSMNDCPYLSGSFRFCAGGWAKKILYSPSLTRHQKSGRSSPSTRGLGMASAVRDLRLWRVVASGNKKDEGQKAKYLNSGIFRNSGERNTACFAHRTPLVGIISRAAKP